MVIKSRFSFLLASLSLIIILISSCKKPAEEPKIIIETVTDTITITDTLINTIIDDTAMTFILVRHAEKMGSGSDPDLTAAGVERANDLKNILVNVDLDAVFSTNYNRTMQTATPTATNHSLSVINYSPSGLEAFVDENLINYPQGKILVVGHSNTTPSLLNILTGGSSYADIPETEYDNMYIVTVFEKGNATVLEMKYGE